MLWKPKVRETQHSRTDKKLRVLKTGAAKIKFAESSHSSVSDSRRPPVKGGHTDLLTPMAGRTSG